jgi:hypothetical protein
MLFHLSVWQNEESLYVSKRDVFFSQSGLGFSLFLFDEFPSLDFLWEEKLDNEILSWRVSMSRLFCVQQRLLSSLSVTVDAIDTICVKGSHRECVCHLLPLQWLCLSSKGIHSCFWVKERFLSLSLYHLRKRTDTKKGQKSREKEREANIAFPFHRRKVFPSLLFIEFLGSLRCRTKISGKNTEQFSLRRRYTFTLFQGYSVSLSFCRRKKWSLQ